MFELLLMVGRKEHDNGITVLLTCLNTRYINHGSLTNLKNFDSLIVKDINVPVELCETEFPLNITLLTIANPHFISPHHQRL